MGMGYWGEATRRSKEQSIWWIKGGCACVLGKDQDIVNDSSPILSPPHPTVVMLLSIPPNMINVMLPSVTLIWVSG